MVVLTMKASTSFVDFLEQEVVPRLKAEDVFTHQSHQWQKDGTKWRGGCPWHDSKSGTAFYVNTETLLWRCPACGVGGGPVQYLYRLQGGKGSPRGDDFKEVVRQLAKLAGVACPERALSPEEQEAARRREARRAILETVNLRCQQTLWTECGEAARAYLKERGLSEEAVRDLGVGLYLSSPAMQEALQAAGHDKDDIRASCVAGQKLEGYITLPWQDERGQPLTIYGTCPSRTPPPGKPKKMALPNPKEGNIAWEATKRSPYCFDRARRAGCEHPVLVEGLTDAAVAQAHGDKRVIACVAAELSGLQVETLKRCGVDSLTIVLDPDSAGEAGIRSCVRSLLRAGITPYVAPKLPEGLDPDDFILKHGIDAWRQHVGRAEHAYRYVARHILEEHAPEGIWPDPARDAALAACRRFAAEQPGKRAAEVSWYFWGEIGAALGIPPAELCSAPVWDRRLSHRRLLRLIARVARRVMVDELPGTLPILLHEMKRSRNG
jgi:putative DNA primase/helicase